MFSKTRVTDPAPSTQPSTPAESERVFDSSSSITTPARARSAPSVLSADLIVTGNIRTQGDAQIEGEVEGDIRAHHLTVGESAVIRGEIMAEEVIVNGRVVGRVRGLKVRLSATARVEGDIIHKTIAIEAGAHFEGSVQRQENPISDGPTPKLAPPSSYAAKPDTTKDDITAD